MEEIFNNTLQERIYTKTLDNELPVFIMPRPDYNRQYALLSVNCGSIDTRLRNIKTDDRVEFPRGIAHFLEHKLFEDKQENVFDKFAALGSSTNAFTGFTATSYLISTSSSFKQALLNLIDFVQTPYFTEENVDKEKGIITQEIKMYRDDPGWRGFINLLQGLYQKHPVREDIAGTVDSIKQITRNDLYLFYNTFYQPDNMVLFITGDLNPRTTLDIIQEDQQNRQFKPAPEEFVRDLPEEPEAIHKSSLTTSMNISRPLFNIGFKETELDKEPLEIIKQDLVSNMLLEIILGKASQLYQELAEDNLIDDSFSFTYSREHGYGFVRITGETEQPEVVYDRLINGITGCQQAINQENLERVSRKYTGDLIRAFNSFETVASDFVNFYFKGINFFDVFRIMEEINIDDLESQYENLFREQMCVKSIIEAG